MRGCLGNRWKNTEGETQRNTSPWVPCIGQNTHWLWGWGFESLILQRSWAKRRLRRMCPVIYSAAEARDSQHYFWYPKGHEWIPLPCGRSLGEDHKFDVLALLCCSERFSCFCHSVSTPLKLSLHVPNNPTAYKTKLLDNSTLLVFSKLHGIH